MQVLPITCSKAMFIVVVINVTTTVVLPSTKPATFPFLLICVKSTYWDVLNRLAVWCTINYICACWRDISGL